MLAVRLLGRVEQTFGCPLPIRQIFANPTARGLSALLSDGGSPGVATMDPEMRRQAKALRGRRAGDGSVWPFEPATPTTEDLKRASHRSFSPFPIAGQMVERLSAWLCTMSNGRRLHPSAGEAYGVQTYLMLAAGRIEDRPGSWWLDADAGHLLQVGSEGWKPSFGDRPPNGEVAHGAAFAIAFVADLNTLEPLYGTEALRLASLEAGYMGQLAASRAASLDLSLCPLGSVDEAGVGEELHLGPRRRLVHVLLGGKRLESLIREDAHWLKKEGSAHFAPKADACF